MAFDLTSKRCVPCERGASPITGEAITAYLAELPDSWKLVDGSPPLDGFRPSSEISAGTVGTTSIKIRKVFKFEDFAGSMAFVNKVAALAEEEGHHPDINIHWDTVTLELWTHAIGGLSENDFIVAAKIEKLG